MHPRSPFTTASTAARRAPTPTPSPMQELLLGAAAVGTVLVLLWPGARDTSTAIGWLPLWLVGMPLAAWWAARRLGARAPG